MIAEFQSDLIVKVVNGGYVLTQPLIYISLLSGQPKTFIVPEKTFTNFASIPRFIRCLITGHGADRWAAALHDYLYSKECPYEITRKQADQLFLEAMLATDVGKIKAHSMYRAVRLFGGVFYE